MTHPAGTSYLDQANAALDHLIQVAGAELDRPHDNVETVVMVVAGFAMTQPEASAAAGVAAVRIVELTVKLAKSHNFIAKVIAAMDHIVTDDDVVEILEGDQ